MIFLFPIVIAILIVFFARIIFSEIHINESDIFTHCSLKTDSCISLILESNLSPASKNYFVDAKFSCCINILYSFDTFPKALNILDRLF